MLENFIRKHLNADVPEPATADNAEATAAIPKEPEQTAHDDFDWSVDKRNITSYNKEEKEKYDKVYENTFIQLNDGELMKGTVVGVTKTDVVLNIGRSEERRVGKECRFRLWRAQYRKKEDV